MRRRTINVFSLSFLDCICCGLGAVILLFVIVNAKGAVRRDEVTSDLSGEVHKLEKEVLLGEMELVELRNTRDRVIEETANTAGLAKKILATIEDKRRELAFYHDDTVSKKAHIKKLQADLKAIEEEMRRLEGGSESQDAYGDRLKAFPGKGDRQYLTDLKMGGKRIIFLVDGSASMLDSTVVGVIRRRNLSDATKRESPKWRHLVATMDWFTTQLPPSSYFQAFLFNETARPVMAESAGKWLEASDPTLLGETIRDLRRTIPTGGTSLINAFEAIKTLSPRPDNIFLLTDGLPTMGKKKPWRKRISSEKRLGHFEKAVRSLAADLPVNVILYPMEGDPYAASAFWSLAMKSGGSFFCPSEDWP